MSKRIGKLRGMTFDLLMDRPVISSLKSIDENEAHYIAPGTFQLDVGGKIVDLDFLYNDWEIDDKNPCLIHVEMENLDVDFSPKSVYLTRENMQNAKFLDFFVFTGSGDTPEIHPVSVTNIGLQFASGLSPVSDEMLASANATLWDGD